MSAALENMMRAGGAMQSQKQPVQRYVFDNFALGIDRNRNQSPPRDGTLYDLVNAYLTPGHTLKRRNGFTKQQALASFGLTSYGGKLHTFYSGADPGSNALLTTHKLVCPDGSASALVKVHYAAPLLGYLYVVAEFANGNVSHYYLDNGGVTAPTWAATTQHQYGDMVSPTVANGFRYWVQSVLAAAAWQPGEAVAVNTLVQPTAPNGYVYKCTAVNGPPGFANFVTGSTEPVWPLAVGATVIEDVEYSETHTKQIGRAHV